MPVVLVVVSVVFYFVHDFYYGYWKKRGRLKG